MVDSAAVSGAVSILARSRDAEMYHVTILLVRSPCNATGQSCPVVVTEQILSPVVTKIDDIRGALECPVDTGASPLEDCLRRQSKLQKRVGLRTRCTFEADRRL